MKKAAVKWADKHGNACAAAKFGTTERSVYNWQKEYKGKSRKGGHQKHRTNNLPKSSKNKTTPENKGGVSKGRRYGPKEKKEVLEYADKHGVSKAASDKGVSRCSIYDWKDLRKKAQKRGKNIEEALQARSTRPKRNAQKISEERYQLIADTWKKNQALGPRQVSQILRRKNGLRVGTSTCRKVMQEHGYVPAKITVERKEVRKYEAVRPNQQWHLDFLHFWIHKAKIYLLFIEDDYSRYIVGWKMCEGERAQPVCETMDHCISCHGKPEQIVVDAGSGFFSWRGQSQLERLCEDYGIDFIKATKIGANAKLEALNGTVRRELLKEEEFADTSDGQLKIGQYVRFYNLERPHQGLGGLLVPADRYWGRVHEVQAQLERC